MVKQKVAVLSNCSSLLLTNYLESGACRKQMDFSFKSFDYSRIMLGISSNTIKEYSPKIVIIIASSRVLLEEFMSRKPEHQKSFAEEYIEEFQKVWRILEGMGIMILQADFVEPPTSILGDFSAQIETSFLFQIRKLNNLLHEEMARNVGVFPIDILSYQLKHGYDYVFSAPFYYASMMPYSHKFTKELAEGILFQIECLSGKINKCLILDLDNVLWGGILSEDGIDGITICGMGCGKAYYDFRIWIKDLQKRGVLLALCSKNDEDMVKRAFKVLENMVLSYEDFAVTKINWNNKIDNIREIRDELGIGFDAIVFIDDSKSERGSVKEACPDLTVPELPEDPALFIDYLSGLRIFSGIDVDEMADRRVLHYKNEKIRDVLRSYSFSRDEYLKKLDMQASLKKLNPSDIKRAAQLLLRSNRFNLRTTRITEAELEKMLIDPACFVYCVSLKDRYEDYGLVSVIIGKRISDRKVFIYNWVISCRAFERTLEQFVLNCFVEEMKLETVTEIIAEYIDTEKNKMVKDLYTRLGFIETGEKEYCLIIEEYSPNITYVRQEVV